MKLLSSLLLTAAVVFVFGCSTGGGRGTGGGGLDSADRMPVITWEFKSLVVDSEPHTEATLIIKAKTVEKHGLGRFYGGVVKVLTVDDMVEMRGGTLSGFTTFHAGAGQEVLVRYNERERMLIVLSRPVSEDGPPGSFRVIKSIRLSHDSPLDAGF